MAKEKFIDKFGSRLEGLEEARGKYSDVDEKTLDLIFESIQVGTVITAEYIHRYLETVTDSNIDISIDDEIEKAIEEGYLSQSGNSKPTNPSISNGPEASKKLFEKLKSGFRRISIESRIKRANKKDKKFVLKESKKLDKKVIDRSVSAIFAGNGKIYQFAQVDASEENLKIVRDNLDQLIYQYDTFKDQMKLDFQTNGRFNLEDIETKHNLWSDIYTTSIKYITMQQIRMKYDHFIHVDTALKNSSAKKVDDLIVCKVGDKTLKIREKHKAKDLEAFYKEYCEYKAKYQPKETIVQPTQPTKENSNEQSKAQNLAEQKQTDPQKPPTPKKEDNQEITANMQAYVDLLKLSGCSLDEAIQIATDPANKDKFEKFDQTRGVTAYEEAIMSGKIPDNATLGQFQKHVAQTEQRDIYNMDVQPIFENYQKADSVIPIEPEPIPDDQFNKGDNSVIPTKREPIFADVFNKGDNSVIPIEPEPIPDDQFNKGDKVTEFDETFSNFEPEEPNYEVDNSAEPTRVMTPEEKVAYASLQSLPGKDLSGFDVNVYDENPAAFEPSPEDFNAPIQKTSRFQAVAEDLNYLKNQMPMMDANGNMVAEPNSPTVATTSRTR